MTDVIAGSTTGNWWVIRQDNDGRMWNLRWCWGRLRIHLCLMRHRYFASPDRWVFQPSIIWDRKRPKKRTRWIYSGQTKTTFQRTA